VANYHRSFSLLILTPNESVKRELFARNFFVLRVSLNILPSEKNVAANLYSKPIIFWGNDVCDDVHVALKPFEVV